MSIFGDGVVDGWIVSKEDDFTISVSEGFGNIANIAARTTIPESLYDLPINSKIYVYAKPTDSINVDEGATFVTSLSAITDSNAILLAEVITGSAEIESIDNSVRQEIDFIELIKTIVNQHKHRGGTDNPSKIDLASEVQGQLPSFRIADFDADKITTGTFDLTRIPALDHSDLENVGLLTHAQLDTFVQTLEATNKELFGEIGTATLLQLVLALKYIYDDLSSPNYFASRTIDETMVNELAVIPGITPDSSIDFDNSTATINLVDHYVEGVPPGLGSSFYVTYDTDLAWNSAYYSNHLVVSGDEVTLGFNDSNETNITILENFESATTQNQDLTNVLFTHETVTLTDSAIVTANNLQTTDGYWAGKFQNAQTFRSQFTKVFDTAQDWSTYDTFVLSVKCLDGTHGQVNLYFYDSQGNKSSDVIVLEPNEITSDSERNNFEYRTVTLSSISFIDDIKGFVIYTDDLTNPFYFIIDNINIQRAVLLPPDGLMKLRYSSSTNITFAQIEWTSSEPTGTSISVRARSANSTALLNRASFTPYLTSGDLINLSGTDLEVEIAFDPNTARTVAPILSALRFLIVSDSEVDGFIIDDATEFGRGSAENVVIDTSPVAVSLETPVYVDSYYFALENAVNQIHENTTTTPSFAQAELSVIGANTPISPNQVFRAVETNSGKVSLANFAWPRSVKRLTNRSFVVADTFNDRVLELDEDGVLVNGFGSINYEHSDKIFPIAACVDSRSDILYIVWSKPIPFVSVVVSKIVLQASQSGTTTRVQLVVDSDKILNKTTEELEQTNPSGQIMPVYLGTHNAALAKSFPATSSYCTVSQDAVAGGVSSDSVFYDKIKFTNGIPLFVGNFAYIDGVFSPTFADKTDTGSFIVANGTLGVKSYSFPAASFPSGTTESIALSTNCSGIVEVDSTNTITFASNVMNFSPFVPGRVEFLDTNTLLIGGIRPGGQEKKDNLDFRNVSGDSTNKRSQKSVLNEVFFGGSTAFSGAVLVYDRQNSSTLFEYISPEGLLVSDVDVDPIESSFVVAESCFSSSGRIIKVDMSGNITWSFGEGLYSIINSVKVQYDGSMVIST